LADHEERERERETERETETERGRSAEYRSSLSLSELAKGHQYIRIYLF